MAALAAIYPIDALVSAPYHDGKRAAPRRGGCRHGGVMPDWLGWLVAIVAIGLTVLLFAILVTTMRESRRVSRPSVRPPLSDDVHGYADAGDLQAGDVDILRAIAAQPDGMSYGAFCAEQGAQDQGARDRVFDMVYRLASTDPPFVDMAAGVIRVTPDGRELVGGMSQTGRGP